MATNRELLDLWLYETNPEARDRLLDELGSRDLIPTNENDYENKYGLYPDVDDKQFLMKLFHKREFAENKLRSLEDLATCGGKVDFELSPIQRFVSNFLSGKTPYYSALLYHGVGVGKTCAAISIAEANLYINPKKKVYLIAPPNIQPNFLRTIFDINAVSISTDVNIPNNHNGCTGNLYLQLSGTEYEKDKKVIERKVKHIINTRYEFMGYIQLASYIERIVSKVSPAIKKTDDKKRAEIRLIKDEFSGKCLIIDEAHNLRDIPGEKEEENLDAPGGLIELSDAAQGKKLTPSLTRVLKNALNMKLVLLTATPMYNSYLEMIFLLNLLLINDKKAEINVQDIFNIDGTFKPKGDEKLGRFVTPYVSYMRGETPISFPIRLNPTNVPYLKMWPNSSPDNKAINITDTERERLSKLPLVPVSFEKENYNNYIKILNASVQSYGLGVSSIDTMIQSGNWIYPSIEGYENDDLDLEQRIRDSGFDNVFDERSHSVAGLRRFSSKIGRPTWLIDTNLANYSPKAAYIIKRIKKTEGPIFIYSRFIKSGALPLALALEANGYTPYGRDRPLLVEGVIAEGGLQCALCEFKQRDHTESSHTFVAAKYVLLTGRKDISPNNTNAIVTERAFENYNGSQIKVVVGSQVASEGIDLKFIREIYVFDSWFHLNKMEQVLGRGIRTCSHVHPSIPLEKRNCTVYLMVNSLNESRESADLYMYRIGMIKALQIGRISRVIKRYALDCNLNIGGNIILNMKDRLQINAQNDPPEGRLTDINDKNYTNLCDWTECIYKCADPVEIDVKSTSSLTYDEYSSRWRESQVKRAIKGIFEKKQIPFLELEDIQGLLPEVPGEALFSILYDIVNNKSFRLNVKNKEGYLIYRNGFYLFQPFSLEDLEIPLALRITNYPVKTDTYIPSKEDVITEKVELKPDEEEVLVTNDFIQKFWQTFVNMSKKIEKGILEAKNSDSVVNAIREKYKGNTSLIKGTLERLEMINWLYESLKTSDEDRKLFSEVVLEFIWDNFILPLEQYTLVKSMDETIAKVGREQIIKDGRYFRYVELKISPFDIKYICKDGKPCFPAIIKDLEKDQKDIYNTLKANKETTGDLYGFLVPAKEIYTFKSSKKAPSVGKLPEKGETCHNITTLSHHFDHIYPLGKVLKQTYNYDYNINDEFMNNKDGKRKFKSAPRHCSLRELLLRFMDIKKVNNLRWFYRPISAYKTHHFDSIPKKKI